MHKHLDKQSTKITKEEIQNKHKLIIESAKLQIDTIVNNAKKQVMDIHRVFDDGVHLAETNAIEIEKELLKKQKTAKDKNISFIQEIIRKSIHIAAISIPVTYIFLERDIMLLILIPLMFLFVIFDIASKRIFFLRAFYLKIFGKILNI